MSLLPPRQVHNSRYVDDPGLQDTATSAGSLVTIGLIVRNGEATLAQALQSLLDQDFKNFEILVGDNASTDATAEIAAGFALRDMRVKHVRHNADLGVMGNAIAVLKAAQTPYFLWAAADDLWAPSFLSKLFSALSANGMAVACQSKVLFRKGTDPTRMSIGTKSITGKPAERIKAFIRQPNDNSRFYGLFRTKVLKQAIPDDGFYAMDWGISALTLASGTHLELEEILMVRQETDAASYPASIGTLHHLNRLRLLPLMPLSVWLARTLPPGTFRALLLVLCWLNIRTSARFLSYNLMKINALRNLFKPGMRERIRHFIGSSNLTVFNLPKSTAQNATTLLVIPISGNLQKLLELLTAINQRKISGWHCIAVDCGNCDATQITLDDHSAIGYVRVDYGLSFGAAILAAHEQHNRGVKTIIAIDLSACTGPQIELVLAEVLNYAGSRIRSKLRKQHSAVIQLDPIDLHFKDFGLLQDIKAVNTHLNRVKGELS